MFPKFAEPIPNVTVTVGRDALLACVVDNLQNYKVSQPAVLFWLRCVDEEGPISSSFNVL